jgi:hypothetical protein
VEAYRYYREGNKKAGFFTLEEVTKLLRKVKSR